ncbi:hypothetical protein EKE94_16310 [Mesobaculum littorinae]|uniref:Uncharacterized protein n=1 Tax=Mesobaculum littorinae TaxID=2486419 RepID=A0A438AE13_9RHOB|nr:hypothetical protein [Mesobaculum littorinae]RVV96905.1 hypothetical protein EKE94_16310 [Mesobaculum littorinae]
MGPETWLPLLALGALGVAIPWALCARARPATMAAFLRAMLLALVLVYLCACLLFAGLYALSGAVSQTGLAGPDVSLLRHLAWLGLISGLAWGPPFLLAALGLGQRMEARRAARMRAGGR